ncbi:MAG: hypothetical protein PHI78_04995 [Clostridia bacterium]|nr:hypothetical protein [Clostridia bacterium]
MKKKIVLAILSVAVLFVFFIPQTAFADIGQKPSVNVEFSGLENRGEYYVTLLSKRNSSTAYEVYDPTYELTARYTPEDEDYDVWLKFVNYIDSDGFYFLQYFKKCDQTHIFRWGYYAPYEFKILIYFPEQDAFIVSDIYTRYAMDSYYHADVSITDIENGAIYSDNIAVTKNYDFTWETISLVARIVGTVGIEILMALLFRYKTKKQLLLILYTNIATQILLNVALNIIAFYLGWLAFSLIYVVTEIPIFIIEGIVYTIYMPKYSEGPKKRIWLVWIYSFAANLISFATGAVLAYYIPGIF